MLRHKTSKLIMLPRLSIYISSSGKCIFDPVASSINHTFPTNKSRIFVMETIKNKVHNVAGHDPDHESQFATGMSKPSFGGKPADFALYV